ncbi:MAG: hypothetical protein ACO3M9_02390 [Flavobacteriaceae bacterium]
MKMKHFMILYTLVWSHSMLIGQQILDVNTLSTPDLQTVESLYKKEQSPQVFEKGYHNLNEYGINVFAPSLVEAIRFHLRGSGARIENDRVIIRKTMSIQYMREQPLWVLDGIIYDKEPFVNFNTIRKVRVLRSSAETNRYGSQGNAGVIEIVTNLN